jgi:hypothetical protein
VFQRPFEGRHWWPFESFSWGLSFLRVMLDFLLKDLRTLSVGLGTTKDKIEGFPESIRMSRFRIYQLAESNSPLCFDLISPI